MVHKSAIECMLLRPSLAPALARFFADLAATGDDAFFHPHGGDIESLCELAVRTGDDVYLVFVEGDDVLAYGLLRGWNEGYVVPSLGIAVHPKARSMGLGRLVLQYLETMARHRCAAAIRLRVHKDNARAIALYELHGYEMKPDVDDAHLLIGIKPVKAVR